MNGVKNLVTVVLKNKLFIIIQLYYSNILEKYQILLEELFIIVHCV